MELVNCRSFMTYQISPRHNKRNCDESFHNTHREIMIQSVDVGVEPMIFRQQSDKFYYLVVKKRNKMFFILLLFIKRSIKILPDFAMLITCSHGLPFGNKSGPLKIQSKTL